MNFSLLKTSLPRLVAEDTVLLLVDLQEKLLPVIEGNERIVRHCALLLRAAAELKIPVVITEQNPARLGSTLPALRELARNNEPHEKMCFSACTASTLAVLEASERKTVLLCGVEAHVCVLQTALDLVERAYSVFAVRDAIGSRTAANAEIGWQRMMRAGVLPTSAESAVFELLHEAGTPAFKALLPFLKEP